MSVCSGKMLDIVPTLGIVPNRLFPDAFVIVSFTISIYDILWERDSPLSFVYYCYLAIHCFSFESDSVLLTLRYRRAICAEFSVQASLFLCRCDDVRILSWSHRPTANASLNLLTWSSTLQRVSFSVHSFMWKQHYFRGFPLCALLMKSRHWRV